MPGKNKKRFINVLTRMVRSLRNKNYRIYLFGSLTQFAALSMQVITGPLLIYWLTNSPTLLGMMSLVTAIPLVTMSILGGAIADRIQKKKVVMAGLIGSVVVSLSIGLLLTYGIISKENTNSWLILMGAMLCLGGLNGIVMPALQAIIAEIVEREELMNAVAFNSLGVNFLNLLAPAAAGFMIDAFDFNVIYFTIAGLYVCSIFMVLFIRGTRQPAVVTGNILDEIQKGLRYILKDKLILTVLVFTLIITLLTNPYQQLMPIFVYDILEVGATGMGILISVSGAGALAASILLMALPNKRRGLILLISGLVSGLSLVGFSFSSTMRLTIPMMVFLGIGQSFRVTVGSTLLQAYAQPEYLGRVMSVFHIQWGITSLCTFLAGVLAEVVPVKWVLGTMAMILIVISLSTIVLKSNFRRLD